MQICVLMTYILVFFFDKIYFSCYGGPLFIDPLEAFIYFWYTFTIYLQFNMACFS